MSWAQTNHWFYLHRYDVYYEKTDYLVAACLHPFLKFDWLHQEKVEAARRCVEALSENKDTANNKPLEKKKIDEEKIVREKFFRFKRDQSQKNGSRRVTGVFCKIRNK